MPRYLMTHSLLSSWLYAIKDDPFEDATTERDHYAEFLDVLNRVPTPTTESIQNGIEFEDLVTSIANGEFHPKWEWELDKNGNLVIEPNSGEPTGHHSFPRWYTAAENVACVVRGSQFQYKAKKTVTICGTDFLLYGRLDALKAGTIYDIKFSKSYDRGKYYGSTQHPLYLELVPEARQFMYLVSNGADVWTETYFREDTKSIFPVIADFTDWIKSQGLFPIFDEKWSAL